MQKKIQLLNVVISLLTLLTIAGTAFASSPASALARSLSPSEYFYIVSALDSSHYMDIQNGRTDPGTDGIPIITYKKNYPATDNQLWKFIPDEENNGYGYLQSKSNLVLDIKSGNTAAGTPVIAFTKNASEPDNQLWKFVPDGQNGGQYGYFQSKSNLVIDIPGASTALNTQLIAFSKDQSLSPNQIWIKVPQYFT